MDVLWIIVGVLVIAVAIGDATDTLVSNRVRWGGLLWPTDAWLALLWGIWARLGRRVRSEQRREALLSTFAPASLISLVLLWFVALVLGWAMVWQGVRMSIDPGLTTAGDAVYFSGVVFFTVGFGEIVPVSGVARMLVLAQALMGVTFGALVIGFLPSLSSAYSERERQLLLLDNHGIERITPIHVIVVTAVDGRLDRLEELFGDWERWCAAVMESHLSYPMLMWYRSQQRGQSWVTGLGVVMDAALLSLLIEGPHRPAARSLLRRGTRTLDVLSRRVRAELDPSDAAMDVGNIAGVHELLTAAGFTLVELDSEIGELRRLRADYASQLEALIDMTLAPRGFWPSGGRVTPEQLADIDVPLVDAEREQRRAGR